MINRKKVITTTVMMACIGIASMAANGADIALCKSELLGANQTLAGNKPLNEMQKKQLADCLNTPNACTSNFPDLQYNCHYIRNLVNTTQAPAVTAQTQPTESTKPLPPSHTAPNPTITPSNGNNVNPSNNATPKTNAEPPAPTKSTSPSNNVNWF